MENKTAYLANFKTFQTQPPTFGYSFVIPTLITHILQSYESDYKRSEMKEMEVWRKSSIISVK